jgi:multicomponent Na+:H+ antiporter subunit D
LSNDTDAELAQSAEASPLVWGPPAATAFGCVVLFFYAGHIQDFLMPIVATN